MSIHKTLQKKGHGRHRNVLKRFERIKFFKETGKWDEIESIYYGLPKVKCLKIKVKKAKAEKPAETAVATETPAETAPEQKS